MTPEEKIRFKGKKEEVVKVMANSPASITGKIAVMQ